MNEIPGVCLIDPVEGHYALCLHEVRCSKRTYFLNGRISKYNAHFYLELE